MNPTLSSKSSVDEIRERFDADVERFANLETGQLATIDAPLTMELMTAAAVAATSPIDQVLDVGCGAGNNTLKLLQAAVSPFHCHMNDISLPMLQRAEARLKAAKALSVQSFHGDFRSVELEDNRFDVVLAAAVFHHLRDDQDWEKVFQKVHRILRPGGSVWITDIVSQEIPAIQRFMQNRYAEYLQALGGPAYQQDVFAYIDKEDSPRPLTYQVDLLKRVGFQQVEILHKNSCFAAFGAIK